MTELSIRPEEIRDALQRFVSDYEPDQASRDEVGRVAEAGDGIARVTGLPSCMANELLEFEEGTLGLALNLDTREIGVVILGDFQGIEEGQTVRRTGEILSVPVGDGFMGRVIDPLGTPIAGPLEGLGALLLLIALIGGPASLILRMRRAAGIERQQLKWLAYAGALAAAALVIGLPLLWVGVGIVGLALIAALFLGGGEEKVAPDPAFDADYTGFVDGFPVPPMPGQKLPELADVVSGVAADDDGEVAWAAIGADHRVLLAGRSGVPFRPRERRVLELLARLASGR